MITTRNIFVLILLSGITFYISNNLLDGTLKNSANLGGELKSPPDSLYRWNIGKEAPFKYRVLHRGIVSGTYNVLNQHTNNNLLFFRIYKSYALLFHTSAVILFYFLLGYAGLPKHKMAGAIIFALLPSMTLAYNVPVHTREDTLAYCFLILGLIGIIKNNPVIVLTTSLLGVLCRETMLLLPLIYLLFTSDRTLLIRLTIAAASVFLFVLLRIVCGVQEYDHAEGLRWNLHHPDQVIGFTFISFGFLWLPFFITAFRKRNNSLCHPLFHRSAWIVLLVIFVTTFLGGIFNEIRLLYLLAPWIIILSMQYFKENREQIIRQFLNRNFLWSSVAITLVTAILIGALVKHHESFLHSSKYGISYPKWIIATGIQLLLTILTIPFLWINKKD